MRTSLIHRVIRLIALNSLGLVFKAEGFRAWGFAVGVKAALEGLREIEVVAKLPNRKP